MVATKNNRNRNEAARCWGRGRGRGGCVRDMRGYVQFYHCYEYDYYQYAHSLGVVFLGNLSW